MNALLLLVPLVLLVCQCFGARNCTLPGVPENVKQNNATGPDVVNAVINAIECSEVFEDDNGFLRRLAYVETRDGVNKSGTTIWGNTAMDELNDISNPILTSNYTMIIHRICEKLGIYVPFALRNVKQPLVAGVLARFYLHIVTNVSKQNIPPAEDICGQATFWESYYKKNDISAKSVDFIVAVNKLEGKIMIRKPNKNQSTTTA